MRRRNAVGMAAQGQEQFVAPFGVAASMAATVGAGGFTVIRGLSYFALMAWVAARDFRGSHRARAVVGEGAAVRRDPGTDRFLIVYP